jgi:hypothetical protein
MGPRESPRSSEIQQSCFIFPDGPILAQPRLNSEDLATEKSLLNHRKAPFFAGKSRVHYLGPRTSFTQTGIPPSKPLMKNSLQALFFLLIALLIPLSGCASRVSFPNAQQIEQEQALRRIKATQAFLTTADAIMQRASLEAGAFRTQAGKNQAIQNGLEECLELQPAKDADLRVVNEYKELCRTAHRWFSANPTWKTTTAYGIAGIIAGAIDASGGGGLATTLLVSHGARDMHERNEIRKAFLNSVNQWNRFIVLHDYESTYWRF